jgi:hypothetical protein
MTSSREPRPPSEPGENGEEGLMDEGERPAEAARRQADVIAGARTHASDNPAPRREGQRQAGEAGA